MQRGDRELTFMQLHADDEETNFVIDRKRRLPDFHLPFHIGINTYYSGNLHPA